MNSKLRLCLSWLGGVVAGGLCNMGLIIVGSKLIPAPEGVDSTSMESIAANIDKFGPHQFVTPFLAHAVGTLVGVFVAVKLARRGGIAWFVGGWFLIGGISAVMMIPAPMWFDVTDLVLAYFPMAWLGRKLAMPKALPSGQ